MKLKITFRCTLLLIAFVFCAQVFAIEQIPYKNLKNGKWITVLQTDQTWVKGCNKKGTCYKRKILYNDSQGSVYYTKSKEVAFSTACKYEFIKNGKLIGYSDSDLTFYEFVPNAESVVEKRPLSYDEVSDLFVDYKVIKISEFSPTTNSLRVKKGYGDLKLIIYNDKNSNFDFYEFGSNNAKFTKYPLKGFLKVSKQGMIHFSHYGDNTKDNPLYVILVR